MEKRLLMVSSHRTKEWEELPTEEFYKKWTYSLGAIAYNLEKLGWTVERANIHSSKNPAKLAKKIDKFKPSIIYTYGSLTALNPLISRKLFCKHKDFLVVHGWDDVYGEIWDDVYGKIPGLFMHFIEKLIVKKSDAVVTLSLYNQARGLEWGKVSEYIPNACNDNFKEFDISQGSIKMEGDFNILYTGDQAKWKRPSDVCSAMAKLPENIKLYLTGQHYPYLDKYASDNCIFLGYVSKEDMWSLINQCDALVCTANQDCNAKFHEYLKAEKPILGYDERANMLFKNRHNAYLTKDYAAAIIDLYEHPELCKKLVENAKKDIPVNTWYETAQLFDEYFNRIWNNK